MAPIPDDLALDDRLCGIFVGLAMNTGSQLDVELTWEKFKAVCGERDKRTASVPASWKKFLVDEMAGERSARGRRPRSSPRVQPAPATPAWAASESLTEEPET